ncbi:hypothetical protein [Belnapia rosea]|uniref:hypothetical protein n=1 Tax=Belnapia rosea TaxID=938405 RepID=UPI000881307C|nr:hypothetical protein [Belnapia rosea]SDB46232.1 hypothetical protein SAMN02927895_01704 [Belnapia rosea]
MSGRKPLVLGDLAEAKGDVTQNRWVGARSARALEASLGFHAGRLSDGWWVLLLKERLKPADFDFAGITLRSGGRLGLPARDPAADRARTHVSDQILAERGPAGYADLQASALAGVTEKGEDRIVKVIPVTPHSEAMAPADQYPMGGGGLQWTLRRPCSFLVALQVDAQGIARIPGFSCFLGESATYDDRARIARYLMEA